MENNGYKFLENINYLAVGFVIFQLIFCVVCVSSISILAVNEKINMDDYVDQLEVNIKNTDVFQGGLTDAQVDTIQRSFLNAVQRNAFQINLSANDAEIREGSVASQYFKNQNLNFMSAILDIPSLRQSYWVFYESSEDPNNQFLSPNASAVVLCINDPSEIIYDDFECNGMYTSKTYNVIAAKYIKFFNFSDFIVNVDVNNYEDVNIYVTTNGASEQDKEGYKARVRNAIRSLGISPDLFRYNVF